MLVQSAFASQSLVVFIAHSSISKKEVCNYDITLRYRIFFLKYTIDEFDQFDRVLCFFGR